MENQRDIIQNEFIRENFEVDPGENFPTKRILKKEKIVWESPKEVSIKSFSSKKNKRDVI